VPEARTSAKLEKILVLLVILFRESNFCFGVSVERLAGRGATWPHEDVLKQLNNQLHEVGTKSRDLPPFMIDKVLAENN
jgi:hypothetical protein